MTTGAAVELCSGYGQYHSPHNERNPRDYVTITMPDIEAMLVDPPSVEKSTAQWVIFSSLLSRVHAEQREQGQFHALWADLDDVQGMTFDDIIDRANGCLMDFLAYTSRSATEANPKARIIVPLESPIDGKRFVFSQKIFNDVLEKNGLKPDRATERAGQVCYLPNRGEFYQHHIEKSTGPMPVDAWQDEIQAEIERERVAEKARIERMEQAREKARQRMQSGCKSPIDAYVEEFDLPMVLESYGYMRRGSKWLSPLSESGNPGVSLTTDGRKWLSRHGHDANIGMSTEGGTMGDAFDLFVHYEYHGDRNAAVRAAAAMFGLRSERQQRHEEPPPWTYEVPPVDEYDGDSGRSDGGGQQDHGGQDTQTGKQSKTACGWNNLCSLKVRGDQVEKLGKESWCYRNFVLKGQITVVVALPGGGKSAVLFNHVCPSIVNNDPEAEVTYFDLDSPLSDHKNLFERAESYGDRFQWVNPQHSGKDDKFIIDQLQNVVRERYSLENKVLVFDTLKKFCNLMGKGSVKSLFKLLRQLNALGATIILPAHANKYRQEGLLVPEGVGDVKSDTDNLIIIERIPADGGQYASTIVDPDKHAKVRGLFEPISFFIERGTRETTAMKYYIDPPDFTFGQKSSSKISDDEIAAGIRNYLVGQVGHIQQKVLLGDLKDQGFPYNRTRTVLDSMSVPENKASHQGQIYYSTGAKNVKKYSIFGG